MGGVTDGTVETGWTEAKIGDGHGEWVRMSASSDVGISGLSLQIRTGTEIPDGTEIRVHDSNANMRYLVLPRRPVGTTQESARAASFETNAVVGAQSSVRAIAAVAAWLRGACRGRGTGSRASSLPSARSRRGTHTP